MICGVICVSNFENALFNFGCFRNSKSVSNNDVHFFYYSIAVRIKGSRLDVSDLSRSHEILESLTSKLFSAIR